MLGPNKTTNQVKFGDSRITSIQGQDSGVEAKKQGLFRQTSMGHGHSAAQEFARDFSTKQNLALQNQLPQFTSSPNMHLDSKPDHFWELSSASNSQSDLASGHSSDANQTSASKLDAHFGR